MNRKHFIWIVLLTFALFVTVALVRQNRQIRPLKAHPMFKTDLLTDVINHTLDVSIYLPDLSSLRRMPPANVRKEILLAVKRECPLDPRFRDGSGRIRNTTIHEMVDLTDGWGRPYNLAFQDSATNASDALRASGRDLLVWSSGQNGINEYGRGDDIFYRDPLGPFRAE